MSDEEIKYQEKCEMLLVLGCQGKKVQDAKTVYRSTSQFSQTVTQSTGLPVKENTKKKCK